MKQLNLPPFKYKVIKQNGKPAIFDVIRKKYVALTPEEWVRQHFVHYLIEHKGYPAALMANEMAITLNGMTRRCDSVLYDTKLQPRMIIEYKAATVPITQQVFQQICSYNFVLKVKWLIVSNGLQHYCCHLHPETQQFTFVKDIPFYEEL